MLHQVKSVWLHINFNGDNILESPALVGGFKGTIKCVIGEFVKVEFEPSVNNYGLMLLKIPLENIVSTYTA